MAHRDTEVERIQKIEAEKREEFICHRDTEFTEKKNLLAHRGFVLIALTSVCAGFTNPL